MKIDFQVHTFGCKVNSYDSGLIEKRMHASGAFELTKDSPRVHILNTCAVTREATVEAGRLARRLKVRDPFCLVVATGCAAQVDTDELTRQTAIDLIVANSHKTELQDIVRRFYHGDRDQKVFKSNIFKKEDVEPGGGFDSLHTRSFLKIQDGCNSFCTYCVIPFARGKSRSIPIADLVRRVNELDAQGVREVVLTGVHIGDYDDQGRGLSHLLNALLEKTQMLRFRLSSMEPPELTSDILKLFKNSRICPHFHMSIQSAQSEVLHQMKRQYGAKEVEVALNAIAKHVPGAFVGMDVIVGFPSETEAQFDETYARLASLPWSKIHVFPYSTRPGTYAAKWKPLAPTILKERSRRLRLLSDKRLSEIALQQVGTAKLVLPLKSSASTGVALSRDFWTVQCSGFAIQAETRVRITGVALVQSNQAPHLLATVL